MAMSFRIFLIVTAMMSSLFVDAQTNQFRGVNWADPRDNFQSGVIYLSGLSSSDTYESASIVADRIISQFVELFGSNSVRLPINEATVANYWDTYTGAIDVALTKGKVILCFWSEGSGADVRDMNAFWAMWQKVVDHYGDNPNMYFEVFNEPSHLSATELRSMYSEWLRRYSSFPQSRVILDGSGLAMNVPDIGSDSRFDNCLLAVHEYSFFGSTSSVKESDWEGQIRAFVGNYADRTVCTEWGGPMGPGTKNGVYYDKMDYSKPPTNFFEAYIRGVSNQLREWKMGSFYWIGLRDGDWYSLTTRSGEGANITLSINNQSGLERVQYSWGEYNIGPLVTINQPSTTSFVAPAAITIDASASSAKSTITKMSYYLDDELIEEINQAPYSFEYTIETAGIHVLKAVATDSEEATGSASAILTVNVPQGPYGSIAHTIPGIIQLEEYDVGGNGFAYYDVDTGTKVDPAPEYRTDEDVDIEICTDEGGGYNLGWTAAGEWLEYTVNVEKTGRYNIVLRASTDGEGKTISLSTDGEALANEIEITNTSGWQEWTDVTIPDIELVAGEQILRLTIGESDFVNLNYMTFIYNDIPLEPKQLKAGWNVIGCPLEGSTELSIALSSIWNNVECVKDMDFYYMKEQPAFLNLLKTLEWGNGYFIKVNADCELLWAD